MKAGLFRPDIFWGRVTDGKNKFPPRRERRTGPRAVAAVAQAPARQDTRAPLAAFPGEVGSRFAVRKRDKTKTDPAVPAQAGREQATRARCPFVFHSALTAHRAAAPALGPSLRQDIPRPPLRTLLLRARRRGRLAWHRGRARFHAAQRDLRLRMRRSAARIVAYVLARLDAYIWQPATWPFRRAQREMLARTLAALSVAFVAPGWIAAYSTLAPSRCARPPAPPPARRSRLPSASSRARFLRSTCRSSRCRCLSRRRTKHHPPRAMIESLNVYNAPRGRRVHREFAVRYLTALLVLSGTLAISAPSFARDIHLHIKMSAGALNETCDQTGGRSRKARNATAAAPTVMGIPAPIASSPARPASSASPRRWAAAARAPCCRPCRRRANIRVEGSAPAGARRKAVRGQAGSTAFLATSNVACLPHSRHL